jgi:hypothetical protein
VDRSLVSNPFGKPGAKKEMAFQAIKRHIKHWLYSWTRTLKRSKEYQTIKRLLVKWLKSDMVIQATTPYMVENMINWLVQNIFPFINRTVMYLRFYLRTYGEYSNSVVVEVEVNAMKEGKLVMRYMRLSHSTRSIVDKSDLRNSKNRVEL